MTLPYRRFSVNIYRYSPTFYMVFVQFYKFSVDKSQFLRYHRKCEMRLSPANLFER